MFREPWNWNRKVPPPIAVGQAFEMSGSKDTSRLLPEGDIDIYEKMQVIEESCHRHRLLTLQDLFAGAAGRREALVLFLALLELIRLGRVTAVQTEPFGMISIMKTRSRQNAD